MSLRRIGHLWSVAVLILLASCGSGASSECKPDCAGKVCGDDGCGGSCGECTDELSCTTNRCKVGQCYLELDPNYCVIAGSCVPSGTVNPKNPCQKCTPPSSDKGWSPEADGVVCGTGAFCYDMQCCDHSTNCQGKVCGDDGCGGTCGECGEFEQCTAKGECEEKPCETTCEGKDCGDDGCGHSCGTCPGGQECQAGVCVCMPKCAGKECGDDSCGGKCGICQGVNVSCSNGKCVCSGEECGPSCCGPGQVCVGGDYCCLPKCDGKECGDNGCGGTCGTCTFTNAQCVEGACLCPGYTCPGGCCGDPKEVCDLEGECCLPQCDGKECGDDGCGAICGNCMAGQLCLTGVCPPEGWTCTDENVEDWDGCTTDGDIAEFLVNTYQTAEQQIPAVSGFLDGKYVVVWESFQQDAVGWGVFGQRFTVDSKKLGSEFKVNAWQTDNQRNPDVATFADNRFVVAWDSFGQETGDGVGRGVFAQLYGNDGAKQGAEFNVNTWTTGDQYNPSVASIPGAGFVVTWEGLDTDGKGGFYWDEVYFQIFDAQGGKVGKSVVVNTLLENQQINSDVAVLANGTFVVTWQSTSITQPSDPDGFAIFYRLFNADGTPVTDPIQANIYTTGNQRNASVVAIPDGRFAIAWESQGQDGDGYAVLLHYFNSDGSALGSEILVNSTSMFSQQTPALAALPDSGLVVLWESREQDGSQGGIFAQRFKPDRSKLGGEVQMNFYTASNQWRPAVAAPTQSWFVAVWDGGGQDSDLFGVFARRFDAATMEALYH